MTAIKHLTTSLLAGLAIAAVASLPAAAQHTMKLSSPTVGDVTLEWMKAMKAGVEARAGGKIKVELYPAGQLGSIPATVEGVALGTIESAIPATGFLAGLEPRFQAFDLPGIFEDLAHAQKVMADPVIVKMYAAFGAGKGVEPLIVIPHGPSAFISHKGIRTVADFNGMKMRVIAGTPLFVETAKKLGVSPIAMPLGEVLPALQNKALDGSVSGLTVFTSMKYYDIAKVITAVPGGIINVGVLTNKEFLKKLGPELEKIVREEAVKANAGVAQWGIDDAKAAREVWTKNGGEVVDLAAAEVAKYREAVTSALPPILGSNATLKADYEKLLAVAKKHGYAP